MSGPRDVTHGDDIPAVGAITAAVSALIDHLALEGDPARTVYAAQALNLAEVLDSGTAAMAIAAVHRELRELIETMTAQEDDSGDPRLDDLMARLSAPLGNAAN